MLRIVLTRRGAGACVDFGTILPRGAGPLQTTHFRTPTVVPIAVGGAQSPPIRVVWNAEGSSPRRVSSMGCLTLLLIGTPHPAVGHQKTPRYQIGPPIKSHASGRCGCCDERGGLFIVSTGALQSEIMDADQLQEVQYLHPLD